MNKGKLYLIPTYLSSSNTKNFLSISMMESISHIEYYLVENVRTSRRFISSLKLGLTIESLKFSTYNKDTNPSDIPELLSPIFEGNDMGLISEAGLPGIADPGEYATRFAHEHEITVVPLPGSSSIILALVSSGLSGQHFTFHGYLPIQIHDRQKRLEYLEKESRSGYTQIFMETPYRNANLFRDLLKILHDETWLTIAADITGSKEYIKTRRIKDWKRSAAPIIQKTPAIFLIGNTV